MAWVFLACAGLLEVFWSSFLKLSDGFTKLGWSVMTIAGMLASFYLLSQAMKTLPLGTAYAVWTGIGALMPKCLPAFRTSSRVSVKRKMPCLHFWVKLRTLSNAVHWKHKYFRQNFLPVYLSSYYPTVRT